MTMGTKHGAGRLVAVVVTYNRLAQLQVTLPRLLNRPETELAAVLVVDNASSDGTAAWLATQEDDPRLQVLRCETNLGGAGGFETGMRAAVAGFDPDWIVVMDDDARPEPDALTRFHAQDRSGAEAWAAAVYHLDGRICDMNRPSINPFWHKQVLWRTILGKGRDGFHIGQAEYSATTPCAIDGTSFVGFFISRAGIERVGYPDGRLFLYGDDVLYTLGLSHAGGRILFDPDLRFEHDFSTMTDEDKRFRPLWKSYYHYRNLLMVYRMASGLVFWLVLPAAAGKWLLKLRHHSGERLAFTGLVLRALRDGLLSRTDVPHATVLGWAKKRG
ncbi:glycosyltransferase [Primorskyibacter sp. 2E233]|uniref:glycosyltransferase n=1 Tax=Primorskyibacter sp. 2E233 TaxID=3413431 RepID=UPI003BF27F90